MTDVKAIWHESSILYGNSTAKVFEKENYPNDWDKYKAVLVLEEPISGLDTIVISNRRGSGGIIHPQVSYSEISYDPSVKGHLDTIESDMGSYLTELNARFEDRETNLRNVLAEVLIGIGRAAAILDVESLVMNSVISRPGDWAAYSVRGGKDNQPESIENIFARDGKVYTLGIISEELTPIIFERDPFDDNKVLIFTALMTGRTFEDAYYNDNRTDAKKHIVGNMKARDLNRETIDLIYRGEYNDGNK